MDETIVGTIALLDIGNNNAALRKMFVTSAFRGRVWGVGQSLLNNVFEWAIKKNEQYFPGYNRKIFSCPAFFMKKTGSWKLIKNYCQKNFQ